MDYAKNELRFRLEDILSKIDESGVQEGCIVDEEMSLVHSDLLQHVYGELECMISDIDMIGIEEDDHVVDLSMIMEAKECLMIKGYDIMNKEIFPPSPIIFDPIELSSVNYLKLCNYHLHDFPEY